MLHVISQRERDKAVILKVIREFGPISRVGIHQLTRLRANTISDLTQLLLADGRLSLVGPANNPTGRKQTLLNLNPDYGVVAALEYDAERLIALLCDLRGNILHREQHSTARNDGETGLLDQLKSVTRRLIRRKPPAARLLGIGLADMGIVNASRGSIVMSTQLPFWKGIHLQTEFESTFNAPVVIRNATRCRAHAERVLGAGKGLSHLLYIEYGSGIGATQIEHGQTITGHHGGAGEFGHIRISAERAPCPCGGFGCLEALASIDALRTRYLEVASAGGQTIPGIATSDVTGWDVLRASAAGVRGCALIVEAMIGYLAQGLASLVNLMDPRVIILDSRLAAAGPDFLAQLTRSVKLLSLPHFAQELEIYYGTLGQDSGALGIAFTVLDSLFEIPELKPPQYWLDGANLH
jgi:predicted NBD/HSP70 family sugar kinase